MCLSPGLRAGSDRGRKKTNIIDEIELDVRNGIWKIEFNRCVRDIDQLRIFITMPTLTSLHFRFR